MKGLLKFLFAATFGALYGLLFAQKSGKKLRSDLRKSENPFKILLEEGKKMEKESREVFMDWADNCDELQQLLITGKTQFNNFVDQAKHLSEEGKGKAQKKLEELSENVKSAISELRKTSIGKVESVKKDTKEKGAKFKNELKKEVKTIAKKMDK